MLCLVARLVLIAISLPFAADPRFEYHGELRLSGFTHEIGVAPEEDGSLSVDVISSWLIGARVPTPERHGDEVRFPLPAGLGELRGRMSGESLVGDVTLPDGRRAPIALARAPRSHVRLVEMEIRSGDVRLAATLGLPAGTGPFPAVVFVHGGGDSSRENAPEIFLAKYLPRFGIACLVHDKRGCGASTGAWKTVGFEERARDVVACMTALESRPEIDARRIGLYAGSQGSWVAGVAAASDPSIAFIVHHSGPLVTPFEADRFATASAVRRAGAGDAGVSRIDELFRLECDAVRSGSAPDADAALLGAIERSRREPWFEKSPYTATPESHWWPKWYAHILDHDPVPILRRLDIPMLWLFGARDSQSDPKRNLEILGVLASRHRKDYTVHVFPGAGHGISVPMDEAGNDLAPLTMGEGYFPLLVDWIRSVTRGD
jgi:pimeloyl-ACP methyl ester carboxylesterase